MNAQVLLVALPVLAAAVTWALVPPLRIRLLAGGMIDQPGARRSHSTPTPRGAGLAMSAGLLALLLAGWGWVARLPETLLVIVVLSTLGWLDDRRGLGVAARLLVQCAVAGGLLIALGGPAPLPEVLGLPGPAWFLGGLAAVAVVWLINLHNFMDGSDGLAAMQACWSGLAMGGLLLHSDAAEMAVLALGLAAVSAAFLRWNWPPARVFMGDAGSMLLGGMIAWLALLSVYEGLFSVWQALIVMALFLIDATATLLSRLVRGERWYTPHRSHAYQRLIAAGRTHRWVLGCYAGLNLGVVLPALVASVLIPGADRWLWLPLLTLLLLVWGVVQSATKENNSA